MQLLVFLDLDDTLFQSQAKCPEDQGLYPAAYLPDGRAHSWMTRRQQGLWGLFAQHANASLIPTTARDLESFRRVDLPFTSWCILDHGGVILEPQGQADPEWLARSAQAARATFSGLQVLLKGAQSWIERARLAVRIRLIADFGIPFYVVAKYRAGRLEDLDRLQQDLIAHWIAEQGGCYRLCRNGNNLAILPRWLGKEWAVRQLIARLAPDLTLGIGDSLSDGAFMAECDYAVLPRRSQLFAATLAQLQAEP